MVKTTMVLGLGVGYVLGARAGRERFDQLKDALGSLKDTSVKVFQSPKVQQARKRITTIGRDKPTTASQEPLPYATSSSNDGVSPQYHAS